MVPGVSKLGVHKLGKGGAHRGVVLSFVIWQRGTQGGSRFCACGHPFVLVLGHSSSFGGWVHLWAVGGVR